MRVTDIKYLDFESWLELWEINKQCTLNCMIRNMTDDLNCGYDYFGKSIQSQKLEIESYKKEIDNTYDLFKTMNDSDVEKWCFYELKKHGII